MCLVRQVNIKVNITEKKVTAVLIYHVPLFTLRGVVYEICYQKTKNCRSEQPVNNENNILKPIL